MTETLVRVEFLVEMGDRETPVTVATEYRSGGSALVEIPPVPAELACHLGESVDMVRVTVFRRVEA